MSRIIVLVKRNTKLFLRDKATVFFSFLSTIILVALYFLFIAKIYTSQMDNPDLGGISMLLDENAKNFIVYLQMMAGVLVLNSMSLATGAFSTIAKDFESKRVDNLLLTPVKTHEIILSHYITGLITSFTLNFFTWLISFVLIGVTTGCWLAAYAFFAAIIVLLAASLISCSIMLLVTSLIKSSSAIGVVNGISGTFFGFLCGIYMPYSNLGESTKVIGSLLPFSHLTIWLKQVVLNDALSQAGITGAFRDIFMHDFFSAESIGFCGLSAPLWLMLMFCGALGLLCLAISYVLLGRRIKGARM